GRCKTASRYCPSVRNTGRAALPLTSLTCRANEHQFRDFCRQVGRRKSGDKSPHSKSAHALVCCLHALTVLCINMAMVMGPTPPGTGVILLALACTARIHRSHP